MDTYTNVSSILPLKMEATSIRNPPKSIREVSWSQGGAKETPKMRHEVPQIISKACGINFEAFWIGSGQISTVLGALY